MLTTCRGRANYAQIPTFFVRITKYGRCGTILAVNSLRTAAVCLAVCPAKDRHKRPEGRTARMKRWIFGLCALLCTTSLVGCGSTALPDPTPAAVDSPVAGKKVAYIMQMAPSDIFQMWSQSA